MSGIRGASIIDSKACLQWTLPHIYIVLLKSPLTAPWAGEIWVFIEIPKFFGCLVSCVDLVEYMPATNSASWVPETEEPWLSWTKLLPQCTTPACLPNGVKTLLPWHWNKMCCVCGRQAIEGPNGHRMFKWVASHRRSQWP